MGSPWQKEKRDLLEELMLLPENAVVRRINELVKRARSVKVHAYIIHYLRKQMPYMMGKQDKQVRVRFGDQHRMSRVVYQHVHSEVSVST